MQEAFKQRVIAITDNIITSLCNGGGTEQKLLFGAVKPVVNLARPALEAQLRDDPESVRRWLEHASREIDATLALWRRE